MISSPWLAEMNVSVGEDSLLFTACQSRDGGLATSQHERGIEKIFFCIDTDDEIAPSKGRVAIG